MEAGGYGAREIAARAWTTSLACQRTGAAQPRLQPSGRRLASVTQGGVVTAFVGGLYEVNPASGVTTTYYYAGSSRVAMRTAAGVTWLQGDHLGSASLATNAAGAKVSDERYLPYGATRSGGMPTPYRFTGQRLDTGTGLYYYGARYYDAALGRFISADTIVPGAGSPQDLNRYAYTRNNPLRYTDPSGHYAVEEEPDDSWIYSDGRVRSEKYFTHPEYQQREATDTDLLAGLAAPPLAALGIASGGFLLADGVGALGGWNLGATGKGVAASLCADGNCLNEIETGTNVVYQYVENGVVRYIGITNNFARRAQEHLRHEMTIERIQGLATLSRFDARAVEQMLIEQSQLVNLLNRRNSIATMNPIYDAARARGTAILMQVGLLGGH